MELPVCYKKFQRNSFRLSSAHAMILLFDFIRHL
jgi:hypothetical protein